jgi:hypothetical protein
VEVTVERFGTGERLSLAGAAALLISLLLPWYRLDLGPLDTSGEPERLLSELARRLSVDAFEAFRYADVALALLAVTAFAGVVLVWLGRLDEEIGRHVESVGGVATLIVLFRTVSPPGPLSPAWGIAVALAGSLAIAGGAFVSRRVAR